MVWFCSYVCFEVLNNNPQLEIFPRLLNILLFGACLTILTVTLMVCQGESVSCLSVDPNHEHLINLYA